MEGTGFHLPKQHRVRLRNTVDPSIYGDYACVGNEGWVEDNRQDRFGLPEVFIKWDKNHWAYNGVPDCWTFEEHFELVEDTMDKKEQAASYARQFAEAMASLFAEDTPEPAPKPSSEPDLTTRILNAGRSFTPVEEKDPYQEATEAALQRISNAEGFVLIGVEHRKEDGILEPFAFGFSKTLKAELAVQAHMTGVSARANQELALQNMSQMDK